MSRRNGNEFSRKQPEYPMEIYQEYYSELDLSMARDTPREPPRHYLSRPRLLTTNDRKTKKNLTEKLKSLANKANETFQKTFKRDVSKQNIGRGSVSSLPDTLNHPSLHRRGMTARPLPSIPPPPTRNRHQRRPTGPREMPMDIPEADSEKKQRMEDLKQMQGSINIALEDLCHLVGVYNGLEDTRVEQSIMSKIVTIKENVSKLQIHVQELFKGTKETVAADDDQMTAVHRTSRSSSADSIEQLKNLTQRLVHDITKTRKAPRVA